MMNFRETKLNELVDKNTPPFKALAGKLNTDVDTVFAILCEAFDKAASADKIYCDDDGWSFSADFAEITLVRNNDWSSSFERYLKFDLTGKESFAFETSAPEETITELCISEPPETLDSVELIPKNLELISMFATGARVPFTAEMIERLKAGYRDSKIRSELIPYEESFNFNTGFRAQNGEPIMGGIKYVKKDDGTYAWILNYAGYNSTPIEKIYAAEIENFADFGRNTYLSELAALARPEKWHFSDEAEGYEILKNYIAYTFYKVNLEGKVFKSKDSKFAAFHTGLASASYDDIYMCFTGSGDPQNPAWRYAGICTTEKGYFHKHLISYCNPLPQPAQYIKRKEDVLYDMNKKLYVEFEHIILKRLHRIPLEFLKMQLFLVPEAFSVICEIENANGSEIPSLYEKLSQTIEASPTAYEILKNALNAIVEKTLKIIRWNYRLAIPSYFPTGDTMSLLLPMDFLGKGEPQAALVIQLTGSDNYIGHTILSMKHSYLNARLIGSQESSWLTT